MSWFPEWSSIVGVTVVIGLVGFIRRIRRIRHMYAEHRVARFFDWPFHDGGKPIRVYWLEGVTQSEVENALYGYTDRQWGWLCSPRMRKVLTFANPASWALVVYGSTDLPFNLGFSDSAVSLWGFTPIPLWLAVRRSVRLVADAPDEMLDERLVALRDRTYVGSYRVLAFLLGVLAASMIVLNDFNDDLGDDAVATQLQLLTAVSYASIWAVLALPSVLLAWTLRNEHPTKDA